MKKFIIGLVVVVAIPVLGFLAYKKISPAKKSTSAATTINQQQTTNTATNEGFDKQRYSLIDPNSIWLVVNKKQGISESFVPKLVVPDVKLRLSSSEEQMHINTTTAPAIKEMFTAAQKENVTLVFGSGYRSGALQRQFYESYKAKDGQAAADTYSARPGHSEHQTGFAVDLTSTDTSCHLQICWEDTPEGKWVAANAYKYGFIIRYPKDKQDITGYQYEPWHVRYVGKELAAEIHNTGQTLEEFFNLGAANNYD